MNICEGDKMEGSVKGSESSNKTSFILNNIKLFTALFIFCLILRDMGGLPLSKYVFIGAAALLFTFCDESRIIMFIAFITPLSKGVSYSFITVISIIFLLIKRKGKLNFDLGVVFSAVIIVIELLNMLFYPDSSIVGFFRTANIFVLLVLLFLDKRRNYNYQMILKYYLFGFFVLTIFTFFWIYKIGSISQFFQYGTTLGDDMLNGIEGNKIFAGNNDMGLYAVMTIAVAMLMFYTNAANKLLLVLIISLGFVMGFISTSRGFLFSAGLCIILFVFISIKSIKSFLKALVISVLIFSIALVLINTVLQESYITFMSKMNMSDFSNGRVDIFKNYMNFFINNTKVFFIGVGMQNYQIKSGLYQSIHNAVQEALVAWGTVGFISVIGFFASLYKSAVSNISKKHRKMIYVIPSIIYLFYVQFNQLFSVTSVMLIIVIVYSAIALSSQQHCQVEKGGEQIDKD
jgi:hypothetical protein